MSGLYIATVKLFQNVSRNCSSMCRFPAPAFGPIPGSGPKVLSVTDLPNKGELTLPIGAAGFTLFNTLRIEAENVRLYFLAVATPPNTLAMPDWLEPALKPPLLIASPPRISSAPLLPPTPSPKDQVRLKRAASLFWSSKTLFANYSLKNTAPRTSAPD